jgi:MFS family permease
VLAIGMMGIFLPFTIYLQSVTGFSALKAGLAMAPASLISLPVAPVAGRLTDKIGGKYILMSGLLLFGGGMGWLALIATPTSSWQSFLAPLIVAGFGMGCVFAPLVTVAMRNIQPQMAGAASGVLNTVRQVGLVIGTAAVGALLQNRLLSSMTSQARTRSAALPAPVRGEFISKAQAYASNGLQAGSSQSSFEKLVAGFPHAVQAEVGQMFRAVWGFGYIGAMRDTMLLPVILLAVGAVSCLALRQGKRQTPAEAAGAAPATAASSATASSATAPADSTPADTAPTGSPH